MCVSLDILNNLFKKVNEMENTERNVEQACHAASIDSVGSILSGIICFKSSNTGDVAFSSSPLLAETKDADVVKMLADIKRGVGHLGSTRPINLSASQHQRDRVDAIRILAKKPTGNVLVLRYESFVTAAAPNVEVTVAVYSIDNNYGLLTLLSKR